MPNKFKISEVIKRIDKTKRELPKVLANQAQNYFVMSWRKQGFNGNKWQEVKRRIAGTNEYKYPKTKGLSRRRKDILINTGRLRRDVANSVVVANWNKVQLVIQANYAKYHNEGTNRIPQRQFVGQTKELTAKQLQTIDDYFKKVWQVT